jgi:hypothetical protein
LQSRVVNTGGNCDGSLSTPNFLSGLPNVPPFLQDTTGHILDPQDPEGDEEGGGDPDLTKPINVAKSEEDPLLRKDNKAPETPTYERKSAAERKSAFW